MTDGAIDSNWDDAEKSYEERLATALEGVQTEPMPGGVAIDLVTRQPLFVRRVVAVSLAEYFESEGFDLATYKTHPWLPGVDADNRVFECVFIDGNPENVHKQGKTYDFPEGRLMHLPVERAWNDGMEVGDV